MMMTSRSNNDSMIEEFEGNNNNDHDESSSHCLVCYSNLDYVGITSCGHNDICGVCHLRLRYLHNDHQCSICKTNIDKVIVDVNYGTNSKSFDEYPMWGDELGEHFIYRSEVGMFFNIHYYSATVQQLFGYQCRVGTCPYEPTISAITTITTTKEEEEDNQESFQMNDDNTNNTNNNNNNNNNNHNNHNHNKKKNNQPPKKKNPVQMLVDHLRGKHRLSLCQLCVDNKRNFIVRLPRFTPNQLKLHLTKGEGPGSGFEGHPICEFCKPKRFYDVTHLHMHLNKDHYKCHICEKQGKSNQFFKNYESLVKHFDRSHFLCQHESCLQARFVVFENEFDLQVHQRNVHGGSASGNGAAKIQLEFRVRRPQSQQQQQNLPATSDFDFGLDGEAFVPDDLPSSSTQHQDATHNLDPLHVQRTQQIRAQAALIRQRNQVPVDNFPLLASANNSNNNTNEAPNSSEQQQQQQQQQQSQSPFVGWTSGTTLRSVNRSTKKVGEVTKESFPALPGAAAGGNKKSRNGSSALTNNRQFVSMNSMASVAAPRAAPSVLSNTHYFPPMPLQQQHNRLVDLAPTNFPSLGRPAKKPASTHFTALPVPTAHHTFPALGPPTHKPPPALTSNGQFPTLPVGTQKKKPPQYAGANSSLSKKIAAITKNSRPTSAAAAAASTSLLSWHEQPQQRSTHTTPPQLSSSAQFPAMMKAPSQPPVKKSLMKKKIATNTTNKYSAAEALSKKLKNLQVAEEASSYSSVHDPYESARMVPSQTIKKHTTKPPQMSNSEQFPAMRKAPPPPPVKKSLLKKKQTSTTTNPTYSAAEALSKKLKNRQLEEASYGVDNSHNENDPYDIDSMVPSWNVHTSTRPTIAQQKKPSIHSTEQFPSMMASPAPRRATANASWTTAQPTNKAQQRQQKPSINSKEQFPSMLPAPNNNNNNNNNHNNSDPKVLLKNMQTHLGAENYKKLKRHVKDFARGKLSPEGFIDACALFFPETYRDPSFWLFIPSLLLSCPDEETSGAALHYMETQRNQQHNGKNGKTASNNILPPPPGYATSTTGLIHTNKNNKKNKNKKK